MQKIKKGDNVKVLAGKDRGKTATVQTVLSKEGKVLLPEVNVYKRHIKRRQDLNMEGGIIDVVKPIDVSNVALVCPKCKKTTRVGFEVKDNEKRRICRKCQEVI